MKMSVAFAKQLQKRIQKFEFEVGILADGFHREPLEHKRNEQPKLSDFAGGPVRKASRQSSGIMISQVFVENQERLNVNLLQEPFKKSSSEIIKFTQAFLKMVFGKGETKRVENLLQAIVRNPILRGDYGHNRASTADNKGFDRNMIDTGQMFKAIKARVKNV